MGHLSSAVEPAPPPHVPVRRAILSVSDKEGLDELARGLAAAGVELYASGGTRQQIGRLGLAVQEIGQYTGFPEMLDGRVKTLIIATLLLPHRPGSIRGFWSKSKGPAAQRTNFAASWRWLRMP
jgi:hypothetical protein